MKAKKYLWSIICVYFCYLTHGIQAIILSQNNVNFAKQWGFNMSDPQSAAYAAGLAAVSTAVAWTGFGKFVSVWIGGEISDRVGRKKLMIGGAALYIICFLGFLFTKSALVASVCGFASGVATSGFWDASGYPAVQEAYPAAPGSALVGIKFFVSLSGMVYPLLVVHNANSGNWKLNVMIPVVMSIICLVLAIIAPFVYDDQKKASEGNDGKSKDAVQAEIDAQNEIIAQIQAEEARKKAEEEKRRQEAEENGTTPDTTPGDVYSGGAFVWPCPSSTRVTSDYGTRLSPTQGASSNHKGLDIGASYGASIVAAADGTVSYAGYNNGMGNYVMISHGSGLYTVYGHASALLVSTGDKVTAGQTIAQVGSTGISTGNHLHFGVSLNGSYVSPWNYLSK